MLAVAREIHWQFMVFGGHVAYSNFIRYIHSVGTGSVAITGTAAHYGQNTMLPTALVLLLPVLLIQVRCFQLAQTASDPLK